MIGNPAKERKLLAQTYEDLLSIYRSEDIDVGSITKKDWVCKYSEILCALSYGGGDKSSQSESANRIEYDAKIFTDPEVDIQVGDRLQVTRYGRELSFEVVGRPAVHPTHQDVKVRERGLA